MSGAAAPGESRRARRERAMVSAAKSLFLERGYDNVSMGDIVRLSGGSLSTLYDLFGNKQGLLCAVVNTEQFEGIGRLRAVLQRNAPPADVLHGAACDLIEAMLDPEIVGLMRLVTAEGLANPEFAANVQAAAHQPLFEEFTRLFEKWNAEGVATFPEPELSAHMFISLFFYAPQMRALFLDPDAPRPCGREDRIRFLVDAFLAGAATPCRH